MPLPYRSTAAEGSRHHLPAVILLVLLAFSPASSPAEDILLLPPAPPVSAEPEPFPPFRWFDFDYELDAYYSNVSLTVALTQEPIPYLGERSEEDIYRFLLPRVVIPRFLYFEASFNPLPYLGSSARRHHPGLYADAELSENFNWIQALTAGFEEPWAASVFAGTVVDFRLPGKHDTTGKGYSGYLVSAGNYHIRDNELIKDDWWELEWKLKGDRKSPIKKLNWSFRVGAKLHGNPGITDIIYLSVRRSRVDYRPGSSWLFNNSGFEYTYDMNRRGLHGIRHYLAVDKKWPYAGTETALSLAIGFVWESRDKYTGSLAAGRTDNDFQFLFQPNIEF